MQVRPEHAAGDAPGDLQHVVMVVPVDPQHHEAEEIGEEGRNKGAQRLEVRAVRRFELKHHDGDEHRHHAVAERFEPRFRHGTRASNAAVSTMPRRLTWTKMR